MKRFLLLFGFVLLSNSAFSQNTNLSEYSFVVVPERFDFQKERNQYKINEMAKFYFEKNGFNAYLASETPNANRCDGLYANVEEIWSVLGTKLQVVLKDCHENEIYRGAEGKSKYKEFEKSFQDALRKAFNGFDALKVQQQKVVLLADNTSAVSVNPNRESSKMEQSAQREITNVSGNMLPTAKYSNYTNAGKSYMLRNTAEGFSLYEETNTAPDGLLLKGKIIVMDALVKYMDSAGKIYDATFDASGNLTIGGPDGNPQLYILKN